MLTLAIFVAKFPRSISNNRNNVCILGIDLWILNLGNECGFIIYHIKKWYRRKGLSIKRSCYVHETIFSRHIPKSVEDQLGEVQFALSAWIIIPARWIKCTIGIEKAIQMITISVRGALEKSCFFSMPNNEKIPTGDSSLTKRGRTERSPENWTNERPSSKHIKSAKPSLRKRLCEEMNLFQITSKVSKVWPNKVGSQYK